MERQVKREAQAKESILKPPPVLEEISPTEPSILPTKYQVIGNLKARYKYYLNHMLEPKKSFLEDDNIQKNLRYLKLMEKHEDPIEISENYYLYLCLTDNCFEVKFRVKDNCPLLCDNCMTKEKYRKRREKRKPEDRTSADSNYAIGNLSPDGRMKRARNLSTERKKYKKQAKRLRLKLSKLKVEINVDDDNFFEVMDKIEDHIKNNSDEVKSQLMKVLINIESKQREEDISDKRSADREKLAERIMNALRDNCKKMDGQDKQVRYQPDILRIALASWLQTPGAYQKFREHSLEIMPSVSTLRKLNKKVSYKEGINPIVYAWFADEN